MNRRTYLTATGVGLLSISGCLGGGDSDVQDSDGDGVIDSADYAPKDPEVQEKSDIVSTETISPSPTLTPTRTPTPTRTLTPTPSPTATATSNSNEIVVDDEYWQGGSHIVSYSSSHVTIHAVPEFPETEFDTAKLYVGVFEFPRAEVVSENLSSKFARSDGPREVRVDVAGGNPRTDEKYHYLVGYVPGSSSESDIDHTQLTPFMESDPFEVGSGGTIQRTGFASELSDDNGTNYSRNNVEGAYQLEIEGRTYGRNWTVDFFAYKSAHAAAVERSRGRSRPEYVSFEVTKGTGQELGTLLKKEAEARNYSKYETVEFAIDFVQALPYVPDDVSTGFDDYTKFIMETMAEMGGDCEDSSIMLASILESDAFYYDAILIQPPGHMAVGIYQPEPEGGYYELDGRKYSYIETTGQGWGIGDVPEEYQGESAYLYQV